MYGHTTALLGIVWNPLIADLRAAVPAEAGVPNQCAGLTGWGPAVPYRSSNTATPMPPLTQSVAIP